MKMMKNVNPGTDLLVINWKMASTYLVHRGGLQEPSVEQEPARASQGGPAKCTPTLKLVRE